MRVSRRALIIGCPALLLPRKASGGLITGRRALLAGNPWINIDGRRGAPSGAAQLPTLLNTYHASGLPDGRYFRIPHQPPWQVAGVDYRVGIPAGLALVSWQTIDGSTGANPIPGVTVSGNTVSVANGTTITGVDFTVANGGVLSIGGASNITIRRCKIGWGQNFMTSPHSSIVNATGTNVTIEQCEFDGGGPTFSSTVTATGATAVNGTVINVPTPAWIANGIDINVFNQTQNTTIFTTGANGDNTTAVSSSTASTITVSPGATNPIALNDVLIISGCAHQSTILTAQNPSMNGNFIVRWCYFHDFNQHVTELSSSNSAGFNFTWKYNLVKDGDHGSAGPGAAGPHLNYLQWGSLDLDNPRCVIEFNTGYQSAEFPNGGEGYQGYCNSGVNMPGGSFGYNTMIFSPNGSGIPHLVTGKNWNAHNNFIDKKGNSGYFFGETLPSSTGNTYNTNTDMTTGRVFGLS